MVVIGVSVPSPFEPVPDGGTRNVAALVGASLFRRFRSLYDLPGPSAGSDAPAWFAANASERDSFRALGLGVDEGIPLPLPLMAHGGLRRMLFAFRGDAFIALDRSVAALEEAIEASVRPAAEAAGVTGIEVSELPFDHAMGNERTVYRVPRVDILMDGSSGVEAGVMGCLARSFAMISYGYKDRSKRLELITEAFCTLRIESFATPVSAGTHQGQEYLSVPDLRFSVDGRFDGPIFLSDRGAIERPCVAVLDRNATASIGAFVD